MTGKMRPICSDGIRWWLRKNPMYLMSAGCIAYGAREMLVLPGSIAGDVSFILLTLVVLQCYEWSVTGFLLILHRSGRSPEDKPSLLLIAGLFWTGPLAATMEMSAVRAGLGFILATSACAIALVELAWVSRVMGYRFSGPGKVLAVACVVTITAAQPALKIDIDNGATNEVMLYGLWWMLAVFTLLALPAMRRYRCVEWPYGLLDGHWTYFAMEVALMLIVVVSTAAHLVAMDHAFFGHAQPFYCSPLIVAVTVVLVELTRRMRLSRAWVAGGCLWIPAVAIGLSVKRFHSDFPIEDIPAILRNPLPVALLLASCAWLYAYLRHRWRLLIHLGVCSFLISLACLIWPQGFWLVKGETWAGDVSVGLTRDQSLVVLYALAAYMAAVAVLYKSRLAGITAIISNQIAVTILLANCGRFGLMITFLSLGWSLLSVAHLAFRAAPLVMRLIPIAVLVVTTVVFGKADSTASAAQAHGVVLFLALLTIGFMFPQTQYRSVAGALLLLYLLPIVRKFALNVHYGKAVLITVVGFLLLATGAYVSWCKPEFLSMLRSPQAPGRQSPRVGD